MASKRNAITIVGCRRVSGANGRYLLVEAFERKGTPLLRVSELTATGEVCTLPKRGGYQNGFVSKVLKTSASQAALSH